MVTARHELAAPIDPFLSISGAVQAPVHYGPMREWKNEPCSTIQDKDDASTRQR
ncbi:MAG: hypothetical protein ABSD13_06050 [Candidatus Korobacteraceae bacterium]